MKPGYDSASKVKAKLEGTVYELRRKDAEVKKLMNEAPLVLSVYGAADNNTNARILVVHSNDPALITNSTHSIDLPQLREQLAKASFTEAKAVIEIAPYTFAFAPLTNVVATLKEHGFKSVHVVCSGSGYLFEVPFSD
jgi:hypothetical protein